jgi:hypothetical protein
MLIGRLVMVVCLVVAQAGCTTTRAMTSVTPEQAKAELHVGDQVRLTTNTGEQVKLKLTAVTDEDLWGITPQGQRASYRFEDLHSVESERFSAARTAGAAVGLVYLLGVLGMLALVKGISSGSN